MCFLLGVGVGKGVLVVVVRIADGGYGSVAVSSPGERMVGGTMD